MPAQMTSPPIKIQSVRSRPRNSRRDVLSETGREGVDDLAMSRKRIFGRGVTPGVVELGQHVGRKKDQNENEDHPAKRADGPGEKAHKRRSCGWLKTGRAHTFSPAPQSCPGMTSFLASHLRAKQRCAVAAIASKGLRSSAKVVVACTPRGVRSRRRSEGRPSCVRTWPRFCAVLGKGAQTGVAGYYNALDSQENLAFDEPLDSPIIASNIEFLGASACSTAKNSPATQGFVR